MDPLKFVMTTTFYPPYHVGGDAMHVYYLSNELAKLGHEVHVIHSIDSYRWQRKGEPTHEYPHHENVTVHSIKSPIGRISPLISYVFGSPYPITKKIRNIIEEVKPDVLHHHNIAGLGPFVLGIKAPKVLYTAHDYWLACPMNGLIRYDKIHCISKSNCFLCSIMSNRPPQIWRYNNILKKYLNNVDIIISPSNFLKNKLQEFGIKGNFVTIPNFVPEPSKKEASLYDFSYFLFVGVLEEHKGILNLIESFLNIKNKIVAKLLIVGNGSLEDSIKNTIVKNNCFDKIKICGRINDLKILSNLYANALAVVIPSNCSENCSLVALEALSNGTPIIVSNRGGLPEIIKQTNAGIIYENDHQLGQILRDFDIRLFKSQIIKEKFNKYYSINNYTEALFKYV